MLLSPCRTSYYAFKTFVYSYTHLPPDGTTRQACHEVATSSGSLRNKLPGSPTTTWRPTWQLSEWHSSFSVSYYFLANLIVLKNKMTRCFKQETKLRWNLEAQNQGGAYGQLIVMRNILIPQLSPRAKWEPLAQVSDEYLRLTLWLWFITWRGIIIEQVFRFGRWIICGGSVALK